MDTLTTLSAGSATKADVTSALDAIGTTCRQIKDAQADLTPERKQQVQDATTAFGTQLQDIVRQAVAEPVEDRRQDAGHERRRVAEVCGDRVTAADRLLSRQRSLS